MLTSLAPDKSEVEKPLQKPFHLSFRNEECKQIGIELVFSFASHFAELLVVMPVAGETESEAFCRVMQKSYGR